MLAGFIALYALHYQQTGVHSTSLAESIDG
jgi:hypothetical protein